MKTLAIAVVLLASGASLSAYGQDALASAAQVVLESAPPIQMKGRIVAIDAAARMLTLKGRRGNYVFVAVGTEATGFDELKIGDTIDVLYKDALLVTANKVKNDPGIREKIETVTYAPGSAGYKASRRIEVIASVLKVDRIHRLVTLRGATATQTLTAAPDIALDDLKTGDTIHAVFQSATAVKITSAASRQH
ncbi:hypothetical protein [Burkholderia cepacia]|uniref:hypothetical protein n=1 Tax=Burkholderia cepacia TaxID=292 RepID=UPI002E77BE00|nr:hypothetical protein [Burkholderia cepacia]